MSIRDALDALILAELDINNFDIHDPMLDDIINAQRTVQDAAPEMAKWIQEVVPQLIEWREQLRWLPEYADQFDLVDTLIAKTKAIDED